jgi:hypothetical protein
LKLLNPWMLIGQSSLSHLPAFVLVDNGPMFSLAGRIASLSFATAPFLLAFSLTPPKAEPTSEQVYKNIQVFKGVPASDLIPAMEFMSASLKYECTDCHDPKDYAADTQVKGVARKMVLMQRDINAKHFNNRLEVTCMTCHHGAEHPAGTPLPNNLALRHPRLDNAPKPADVFAKHLAALGDAKGVLVRTGTMTAPNDQTHEVETKPVEMLQGAGGKFLVSSAGRIVGSNGKETWYGTYPMTDEPAFGFGRFGRAWRSNADFAGLTNPAIAGKDKIGNTDVIVVRSPRPATSSTEELYFDAKTGLLLRLVNIRRSTIGTVVSSIDYSNFKTVSGVKVPMRIVSTYAGGEQWILDFKTAKFDSSISDDRFKMGG